jgi:hypothetical protein
MYHYLMTIITVTLDCETTTENWSRTGRDGVERHGTKQIKTINWDAIKIHVEICDYYCDCNNTDKNTNKNTGSLEKIEKLVEPYISGYGFNDTVECDKIDDILGKIMKLIENNKYARIQKVLSYEYDGCHRKYDCIKDIINDNSDYPEPDISFDDSNDSDNTNKDKIVTTYPFASDFEEIDEKYVATQHVANRILDDIYITIVDNSDGFCCSHGTYEHEEPVQLSAVPPVKIDDIFSHYDSVAKYRKRYGPEYERCWD